MASPHDCGLAEYYASHFKAVGPRGVNRAVVHFHQSGEVQIARETPKSVLMTVLTINAVMFIAEFTSGWLAESTALISDSLDMLADAAVYTVALYGATHGLRAQRNAATIAGLLQGTLALAAIGEAVRRFVVGSSPLPQYMIAVSVVALVANVWCLRLVGRHRGGGVHMTASWIFSQNDVLVNTSVIVGGTLVAVTGAVIWDLALGVAIAILVFSSAVRIFHSAHVASGKLR